MASHSLYRKWRSRSFSDIIGQDHIVRTLRNAVRSGRVAHAYLFTGPRGTGKTSMARILAKAVNCTNPQEGAPCGECDMCRSIGDGRASDIVEIDGASNNSIDDIRALRERVAFAPAEGRFKVYIIDEVHRLSGSAFDGLLKTLEEPPAHVLFIFASTEPHKLPGTILSRCQRFDFHRISRDGAIARLTEVADSEEISIAEDALFLIAQQSGGSLRDALGLLDQVSAFAPGRIGLDDVRQSLGLSRPSTIANLASCILDGHIGDALRIANAAVASGADPRQLTHQLVDYWRNLLLQVSGAGAEVDIDPGLDDALQTHGRRLSPATAVGVLRALTEPAISPHFNVAPQLPLEVALVQASLSLEQGRSAGSPLGRASADPASSVSKPADTARLQPAAVVTRAEPRESVEPPTVHLDPPTEAGQTSTDIAVTQHNEAPGVSSLSTEGAERAEPVYDGMPSDNGELSHDLVARAWPDVVDAVRGRSPSLQALLRDAHPLRVADTEVTLAVAYSFHRDRIEDPNNRMVIEAVMSEILRKQVRVRCAQSTREEIRALRGDAGDDGDDFFEEAEKRLRAIHARRLNENAPLS